MWAGSRAARGKMTVSCAPNSLNYCEHFIACVQFKNVATGCIKQAGGTRVEDP
jgi:hypothetical protein